MAGDNSYKPGEIVKISGIYSVVHEDGKGTFEVTCVEGEHFPPTRSGKGAHFELKYGATHSHKHDDKVGPRIAAFPEPRRAALPPSPLPKGQRCLHP
ncbi:hypothetical protein AWB67_07621 [Caballeronia terrestris]|uniref:Uncharacterized protein n=1 Tax=Caballeronia terrestris TaxID=1226301 RepID=A0A158L5A9_9BURK|nr:hypothetical protein AWB67_07621 [Caballeronia terrestris]